MSNHPDNEYANMTQKEIRASETSVPLEFDDWFAGLDADTLRDFIYLCEATSEAGFKEGLERHRAWAAGAIEQHEAIRIAYREYKKSVYEGGPA